MHKRIHISEKRRPALDLELLARALLELVEDLDPTTRERLAREGAQRIAQRRLDSKNERRGNESAA